MYRSTHIVNLVRQNENARTLRSDSPSRHRYVHWTSVTAEVARPIKKRLFFLQRDFVCVYVMRINVCEEWAIMSTSTDSCTSIRCDKYDITCGRNYNKIIRSVQTFTCMTRKRVIYHPPHARTRIYDNFMP